MCNQQVPVVFQLTTDEKYLWKGISMEDCRKYCRENAKVLFAYEVGPVTVLCEYSIQFLHRTSLHWDTTFGEPLFLMTWIMLAQCIPQLFVFSD